MDLLCGLFCFSLSSIDTVRVMQNGLIEMNCLPNTFAKTYPKMKNMHVVQKNDFLQHRLKFQLEMFM
jgi:hypothetical protein